MVLHTPPLTVASPPWHVPTHQARADEGFRPRKRLRYRSIAILFAVVGVVTMCVSAFDFVAEVFLHWPALPANSPAGGGNHTNATAAAAFRSARLALLFT